MSVYCDKVVGYSLDITNEWENLNDSLKELWIKEDAHLEIPNQPELNYVAYYNHNADFKGKVTILEDGLSGQYCKLVYVQEIVANEQCDEYEDIINGINNILSTSAVPFDIKQNIKRVYKELFGSELSRTSDIKASYIVHYH